jgi:iron-sulfur cluster assembly protein
VQKQELPVRFSPLAQSMIKRLYRDLNIEEGQYLRVGIKGGGCGGVSFLLAFDRMTDQDTIYEGDGFRVIVNKGHVMYVLGMEIDYEEEGNSKGFVFQSPT